MEKKAFYKTRIASSTPFWVKERLAVRKIFQRNRTSEICFPYFLREVNLLTGHRGRRYSKSLLSPAIRGGGRTPLLLALSNLTTDHTSL